MDNSTALRISEFQKEVMLLSMSEEFKSLTEYEFMYALLQLLKGNFEVKLNERDNNEQG